MSDTPIEAAFIDVAHAVIQPPEWVIKDLVPVGLTVLSGPPKKAFKSLQTILMAALCARWPVTALPQWATCERSGPSLLLSYEANAGVVKYILQHDLELEVEEGSIYVAHKPQEFQLDDDKKANTMLDYMDEKEPILVVMDPFRNMHTGDENDSGQIIRLLSPLVSWAHDNHAAVVMVHHVNKPTEGKDPGSFYMMRGSSALPGLADGLLTVETTKKPGDIVINATFKRGTSYRRTVHIGVPAYGWGKHGYEVHEKSVMDVKVEWDKGNHSPPSIAKVLNQQLGQVNQALEDLKRNNQLPTQWNPANIP